MAQFAAPAAMMAAAPAAMGMAKQGADIAVESEDAVTAGFDTATSIVATRPEDWKQKIPELLNPKGDDPMSGAIRMVGAYERFHAAAAERLHPTDNLLNGRNSTMTGILYKQLALQIRAKFCNSISRMYKENGKALQEVIRVTLMELLTKEATISEYLIPGIRNIVSRIISAPRTKLLLAKHLRGECYDSSRDPPKQVIVGGDGDGKPPAADVPIQAAQPIQAVQPNQAAPSTQAATPPKAPAPPKAATPPKAPAPAPRPLPSAPPSPSGAPTPYVEIDFPENMKSVVCDMYKMMFDDHWHKIRAVINTKVEESIRDNDNLVSLNRTTIKSLLDLIFSSAAMKDDMLRLLTGGCAKPYEIDVTKKVERPRPSTSAGKRAQEFKNENLANTFRLYER